MKAIVFKTSLIKIPSWPADLHETHTHGFAYNVDGVYVAMLGKNEPFLGWSYLEVGSAKLLPEWCKDKFGAYDFSETIYEVGEAVQSVWRPGIIAPDQLKVALSYSDEVLSRAGQALRLLVARLDEILLFVEPDAKHLSVYSHKTRDLLISACTEVENYFQHYMRLAGSVPKGRNYTVVDYIKLVPRTFIDEFDVEMFAYAAVGRFGPFRGWSPQRVGLPWYRAYNKTKHNRDASFEEASLLNCINAVGACLILFSVKYGSVWWQPNFINSPIPDACRLFRQPTYSGDPCKVYVPKLKLPAKISGWYAGMGHAEAWTSVKFAL